MVTLLVIFTFIMMILKAVGFVASWWWILGPIIVIFGIITFSVISGYIAIRALSNNPEKIGELVAELKEKAEKWGEDVERGFNKKE